MFIISYLMICIFSPKKQNKKYVNKKSFNLQHSVWLYQDFFFVCSFFFFIIIRIFYLNRDFYCLIKWLLLASIILDFIYQFVCVDVHKSSCNTLHFRFNLNRNDKNTTWFWVTWIHKQRKHDKRTICILK